MPAFPSSEWFSALRNLVNQDEGFRRLGTCDACVAFQVGQRCYQMVFDAFTVGAVRELSPEEAQAAADFVLEMATADWQELVQNIQANGGADAQHTLNTLVFPDRLKLRYRDAIGMDKFYLYNQSLQYFLNAAAILPTTFGAT